MAIKVTTDVFCDTCPNWVHGVVGEGSMKSTARLVAKEAGWKGEINYGCIRDVCPKCLKKRARMEGASE